MINKSTNYWLKNKSLASVQIVGFLFFLFYFFIALYFYQERMMSFDSAGFAFKIAQTKSFSIPLGRWGCAISQILPLIALKTGCSLATFLKLYSISFIFFNYLGFLIITIVFKNTRIGIIYLLTFCLTLRNTFYFSVSELAQGLTLVVVLYSMADHLIKEESKRKTLVFFISLVFIAGLYFFHQLLLIAIVFMFLFLMIKNKMYKNYYLISLLGFTILWFGAQLVFLSSGSYEAEKIPGINVFIEQLPFFISLPSYEYFMIHLKTELLVPFIISIVCGVILLLRGKYLLALFVAGYILAYLILIIITYYKGEAPNMYEQYYIFFGLFIAFLIDVARKKEIDLIYISLIIVPILIFSSSRVYSSHKIPSQRLAYVNNLAKYGKEITNRKFIIHPGDFPWDYGWAAWALPVEVLLASSVKSSENSVTCYVPNEGEVVDLAANNGHVKAPLWLSYLMDIKKLDTNFFKLPKQSKYLVTNRPTRDIGFFERNIRKDKSWLSEIEKKARQNGVSLNEMIRLDAEFLLEKHSLDVLETITSKEIYIDEKEVLKIEQQIRLSPEWLNSVKEKALENNIPLNVMIRLDAEYVVKQNNL